MTSYIKATDFAVKDTLVSGNPAKLVKGTEINVEFTAIQIADATNVKGPGSAVTDNAIMRFDGVTGYVSQNGVAAISDTGALSGVTNVTYATSSTGAAILPSGTTVQRDGSPVAGYLRYNSTTGQFEGYTTAWGSIGGSGGATGGGTDEVVYENDTFITTNYTLGQGAMVSDTLISIATPAVVTVANTFVAGQPVRFTTTGALPTGLDVNTVYYVIATGLTTSSFRVALTDGGAAINTTGTQSGVHSVGKIKNASSAGTVSFASGITVTIPTGATWSIV